MPHKNRLCSSNVCAEMLIEDRSGLYLQKFKARLLSPEQAMTACFFDHSSPSRQSAVPGSRCYLRGAKFERGNTFHRGGGIQHLMFRSDSLVPPSEQASLRKSSRPSS